MAKLTTLSELKQLAADARASIWSQAQAYGREPKIYLHWTAGHYAYGRADQMYLNDYHIAIDHNGDIYTEAPLHEVLAHTWKRNTGSVGVTMTCGAFCTSNDLGNEAPTQRQIEVMARVINVLADALWLTIDLKHVLTHGEAADNLDGEWIHDEYGPDNGCERWDLAILQNGDVWKSGGDTLRGKAAWYKRTYPDGVENHF